MKESELERILVEEVRKEGGKAYKWVSPGNVGVPDRIVFFPGGEIYFVELKADGGRIRGSQLVQIHRLDSFGQFVAVVEGIGGLVRFFQDIGRRSAADRLERRFGGEAE